MLPRTLVAFLRTADVGSVQLSRNAPASLSKPIFGCITLTWHDKVSQEITLFFYLKTFHIPTEDNKCGDQLNCSLIRNAGKC